MNKKIKALWVAALRSGEYKQTKGQLRRGNSFCCLGVLCNLHAQAHPEVAAQQRKKSEYMGADGLLPPAVKAWAGLRYTFGESVRINGVMNDLAGHNDHGRSFKQIADAIEAQL